ncbi:molybdopterin-dependent oxidoreductase [Neorhizobium sp. JUb45]|uniref:molybdopterin-dependent oxidoreductase n=1 Tax=unclassified Neorhizobium TaxID=2629175 RepID=UPI00104EE37F|nr:molybdopterin-dependent oxidoreductase [Neorhizobium sp. JUb45]TCR00092.1 biotin/methionine sulfoxide reductase [Neorhizobium sp. JUb45]
MHLFATHFGTYEVGADANGKPCLLPFRHDPDPSQMGLGYLALADHPERVRTPMIRKSWLENGPLAGTGRLRGDDEFVSVSWDEAADLIAGEVRRVSSIHGNQAIFGGSYGWASAGRFHHAQSQLKRLLNLAGGFTSSVNTYSYGAAGVLLPHVLGADYKDACDTSPSWNDVADHCRMLVAFGGFRLSNAQVEAGGTGSHRATEWLKRCQQKGVEIVVFSPAGSDAPPGDNVRHIPLRPNTDAAVMLGMCHTLLTQGLFDCAFLRRCTVGFSELETYLIGEIDGIPKDAKWASRISGVPARTIIEIAENLHDMPSLINVAWSLQRAQFGEQPFWAAIALACMAGHVGKAGCGFAFGLTAVNSVGQPVRRLKGPAFEQGRNPVEHYIPVARITELLENPGGTIDYDGQVLSLPDIRLIWWAGGNPFHHHQDLNRLRDAFRRPETIIVAEPMWTATAKMADIVLPSAFPFERDDIAASSRDNWLVYSRRAMEPLGGILSDHEFYCLVADRLGCRAQFDGGLTTDEWLAKIYEGYRDRYPELPDFQRFRLRGFAALDEGEDAPAPADHFRRFVGDPDAAPLKTPSGRIEIGSAAIAAFGYGDMPGHPVWMPPAEWLGAPLSAKHGLHLLSPQPAHRLHGQLEYGPASQNAKRHGAEQFSLSTADATRLGLGDGDLCEIYNDRGRAIAALAIDAGLMPGVAVLAAGGWFSPDAEGLDHGGNPNTLTDIAPASTLSQATAPNSCLVSVRLWRRIGQQAA